MKLLASLTRILALVFVLSFAGLAMFQDRLLYAPDRVSLAEMTRGVAGAQPWPSADDFRGLVVEPSHRGARATIVVFHGNAGHAGHRGFYAEALAPLGWRVILAEYPGYGPRQGAPSEARLVADAAETITAAQRAFGGPLYLLGESLGAGVTAGASARLRHEGVAGLLLITPWDSLASVASHHYPWLPVRWLLRDRYDSVVHLAAYHGRAAIVLAEADGIVPARFGDALFTSLVGTKQRFMLAGADHNDWTDRVSSKWWQTISEWLMQNPAAVAE
jgi:thioesterase domain-containing protein